MKDNSQDVNLFGKIEEQFSHTECHLSTTQECNSISPNYKRTNDQQWADKRLTVGQQTASLVFNLYLQ